MASRVIKGSQWEKCKKDQNSWRQVIEGLEQSGAFFLFSQAMALQRKPAYLAAQGGLKGSRCDSVQVKHVKCP